MKKIIRNCIIIVLVLSNFIVGYKMINYKNNYKEQMKQNSICQQNFKQEQDEKMSIIIEKAADENRIAELEEEVMVLDAQYKQKENEYNQLNEQYQALKKN